MFKNWQGKAAIQSLKYFPLPCDVQRMRAEQIVEIWKQEVKRAVGVNRAQCLIEAAHRSIGIPIGTDIARMEINMFLQQYEMLHKQLEQLLGTITKMLAEIPGAKEMESIPGVGIITVAGFLTEVGDLRKYNHPRQIQKLAGLNLKENSSGKHKGRTRITKRGRPRLRALLFRCVFPLDAKNRSFKAFHQYFKTRTLNPLCKMQSLIALCCKLIRVFFGLGTKQIPYDETRFQQSLERRLLQNAI